MRELPSNDFGSYVLDSDVCADCKHFLVNSDEEPCKSCKVIITNFEAESDD